MCTIQNEQASQSVRDPLTIAYLAMGAQNVIDWEGGLTEALSDQYSGELGFIGEVISHASMLDDLGAAAADNLIGIFPYEVAQPFGERLASAMFDGSQIDTKQLAMKLITAISDERAQPASQAP